VLPQLSVAASDGGWAGEHPVGRRRDACALSVVSTSHSLLMTKAIMSN